MDNQYIAIKFQEGPILDTGVNGCQTEDVIEVLMERLQALNVPPFDCIETEMAVHYLQESRTWLDRRTKNRLARGVEGTNTP